MMDILNGCIFWLKMIIIKKNKLLFEIKLVLIWKRNLIASLFAIKKILKDKVKCHGCEVTDFYDK